MSVLQTIGRRSAEIAGRDSALVRRLRPVYESVLNLASFGRGIHWRINGIEYRIDAHFRHQLGPDYDASVAAFLGPRVQPGAVCLDVGANIGVYVLQFAHWSAPGGRVHAFEPNPAARSVLERHVAINGYEDRVVVCPAAVGDETGEATLFAAECDGMSRLGSPNDAIADRATPIRVPIVTLDDYCVSHDLAPEWLFVDVEGFEFAVLAGARRIIGERRDALGIVVEMHPNVWEGVGTTRESAETLLDDLGLEAIPLTGQNDPLADYGIVHLAHRE